MTFRLRTSALITIAAILAVALPAAAQQADVRLPSLGYSAGTLVSPQQATQYGAQFLRELRAEHAVLGDPLVDQYLHTLGYRLVAASPDPTQHYTFTLLNVPEINSFATFGGYIFIFSGLFTMTQNQDELAAVMAHELAHISEHHLQRSIEDQKKSLPLYLAGALLAGIAAGRADAGGCQSGYYPGGYYGGSCGTGTGLQAANAVLALLQQHEIDYSRADEAAADHVGINTLAKAGFDPEGMADVFAHMQTLMRPGGGGGIAAGNLPGFLQNHPVTSVRIAGARARARVLEKQMQGQAPADTGDPSWSGLLPLPFVHNDTGVLDGSARGPSEFQYTLMRERIRVLSSSHPRTVLAYYQRNMAKSTQFANTPSNRYGYALALVQTDQAAQAVPIMAKLVRAKPGSLTLALGLADAERHAGQRSAALRRYATLNATWPNDPAVVLDYSRALLDSHSKADAKTAQSLLKPLLNDQSEPSLYAAYGHACYAAGDEVHAGLAYADATFLSGHATAALEQLRRLSKRHDLDYYTRAQIDARIAEITPIALEIKRRHLDRGQSGSSLQIR